MVGCDGLAQEDGTDGDLVERLERPSRYAPFAAALESTFRSPGLTAFIASNELYASDRRLITNPGPFLRFNATEASFRFLGDVTFTALDGAQRTIVVIRCKTAGQATGAQGDDPCSDFRLEDDVMVFERPPATDGTGYIHELLEPSTPPGF